MHDLPSKLSAGEGVKNPPDFEPIGSKSGENLCQAQVDIFYQRLEYAAALGA
jgi:hypothetical protein